MGYFKKAGSKKVADRIKEYKASHAPDGKNYYKAKTRKNAYVFVNKGSSTQLPSEANTYDALYSNREGSPDVILTGVTVNRGPDLGMLRTADVEFECLRRDVFNKYYAAYLKPGSKVNIEYGYTDGSDSESATDLEVAKFVIRALKTFFKYQMFLKLLNFSCSAFISLNNSISLLTSPPP